MTGEGRQHYNTLRGEKERKNRRPRRVKQLLLLALLGLLLAIGQLVGQTERVEVVAGDWDACISHHLPAMQRADLLWQLYQMLHEMLEALEEPHRSGSPDGEVTEKELESINEGAEELETASIYEDGDRVTADTSIAEAVEFVDLLIQLIDEYYDGGAD